MALGGGSLHGRRRVEGGFRRPADSSRLLPPDRLRLVLALAEPSGRAGFVQELLLALERELVPLQGVIFGISLGVADHLAVALGKGRNRAFGDIEGNDGLALGVEPDPDAERPLGPAGDLALLANTYLHYVLDQWVMEWRKRNAFGDLVIVRYADDFVIGFEHRKVAERFLE